MKDAFFPFVTIRDWRYILMGEKHFDLRTDEAEFIEL